MRLRFERGLAFYKGGGGGGGSGKVRFPGYIEDGHRAALSGVGGDVWDWDLDLCTSSPYGILGDLGTALDGPNPYISAYGYDPNPDFDRAGEKSDLLAALANRLDYLGDWRNMVAEAEHVADSIALTPDQIQDAVDAFEARMQEKYAAGLTRFKAGMADVGAVMTSSFTLGQALLYDEFLREVSEFEAQLTLQNYKDRTAFIMESVGAISRLLGQEIQAKDGLARFAEEDARLRVVANTEWYKYDLDLDIKEATWKMGLYQFAGNFIAAPGGGVGVTTGEKPHSSATSMIGGALSGAAAGSTVLPGVGTFIGAAMGAFAGSGT